jgi:hypothetical protein
MVSANWVQGYCFARLFLCMMACQLGLAIGLDPRTGKTKPAFCHHLQELVSAFSLGLTFVP